MSYGDRLDWPFFGITEANLKSVIKNASDSAPGPDCVKYSHLESLDDDEISNLAAVLNDSIEKGEISDDWLDSHLSAVPKPGKDLSSIKGYRVITMQNTVGKLLHSVPRSPFLSKTTHFITNCHTTSKKGLIEASLQQSIGNHTKNIVSPYYTSKY